MYTAHQDRGGGQGEKSTAVEKESECEAPLVRATRGLTRRPREGPPNATWLQECLNNAHDTEETLHQR